MIMTGGMQYTAGMIPRHDAGMVAYPNGETVLFGPPYPPGAGVDMQYGSLPYSQPPPPVGYGMVPMLVPMPRIAPRELPPFVHWKDKKKPREVGTRDGSSQDGSSNELAPEEEKEEEEEEGPKDSKESSHRARKHGAHARKNTGDVCKFFIKHGSCAYGTMCKFKHPVDMAPFVHFNGYGLPRRPGSEVCKFFLKTGRCSYGHTCKFDHPEVVPYQFDPNVQQMYMQ